MPRQMNLSKQMALRLLYINKDLSKIDLANTYIELNQIIGTSTKLTLAQQSLHCYFEKGSDLTSALVGIHIVGWDTQFNLGHVKVKDFSSIEYYRNPVLIDSNLSLSEQINTFYFKYCPGKDKAFRLSCDFNLSSEGLEINTYLDLIEKIK